MRRGRAFHTLTSRDIDAMREASDARAEHAYSDEQDEIQAEAEACRRRVDPDSCAWLTDLFDDAA
jgi:hypothetical protein